MTYQREAAPVRQADVEALARVLCDRSVPCQQHLSDAERAVAAGWRPRAARTAEDERRLAEAREWLARMLQDHEVWRSPVSKGEEIVAGLLSLLDKEPTR